jgi:iron complex outermembrane receptor protein
MQSETLISYEVGYRNQLSHRISLDLAVYYYDYRDLRAFTSSGIPSLVFNPVPHLNIDMYMVNGKSARNSGGELTMNYSISDRWRLSGSYSRLVQRQELDTGMWNGSLSVLPGALATLRSQTDLTRKLVWDTDFYFNSKPAGGAPSGDSLLTMIQGHTGTAGRLVRLDTRMTWKISGNWDLTLAGENLLQAHHLEMAPEAILVGGQVPRSWSVRLTWRH